MQLQCCNYGGDAQLQWRWDAAKDKANPQKHGISFEPLTGEEVGRIISARKATRHERRVYEKGEK